MVILPARVCTRCGAAAVSGADIEKAEIQIRRARGDYSGRFVVRIAPELHQRLAEIAANRDPEISLNQLVGELLEESSRRR